MRLFEGYFQKELAPRWAVLGRADPGIACIGRTVRPGARSMAEYDAVTLEKDYCAHVLYGVRVSWAFLRPRRCPARAVARS